MTSMPPNTALAAAGGSAPAVAEPPAPAPDPGRTTPPRLLRNGSYLLLMSGLTARALGMGIAGFAIPLVALAITGDVLYAGIISAIGGAGYLVATLPAGVIADRVDRRRLIFLAAGTAAALWLTAAAALWMGALHPAHLALVSFGSQVATAFVGPAGDGGLRAVVPAEQMPTARAAVEGRESVASLLAGPVGGVLYAVSHALPLLGSAIGNLVAAVGAVLIRRPLNGDLQEARRTHPLRALGEGLRYVASKPLFVVMIALAIVLNTASNGSTIAVTLDLAARGTDPFLIGLLSTMIGASLLIGSFLAPVLVRRVRTGVIVPACIAVMSLAFLTMAILPTYVPILACYTVAYLLAPALNASIFSYAAVVTPEQMQGRFSSVAALSGAASFPLAPLVGSALLSGVGLATALLILALTLVAVAIALALFRPLTRIGTPDTWAADA
ncbi:MFS transporter [Microbacterium sp. Marseille-Q6965]|uniref:MFS transporter n=1 Tax=Microbacterium sp. Marseille-Q6965 TaxID=2965072 RepID=UPI0021B7383C|nr:MFS transporter [Microbacterium sp. Marseille-Q6965]